MIPKVLIEKRNLAQVAKAGPTLRSRGLPAQSLGHYVTQAQPWHGLLLAKDPNPIHVDKAFIPLEEMKFLSLSENTREVASLN